MIEELAISNLGVIAEARLPLGPGFTAITGETGAGKTMVVTALGLLMGQRSDAGLVRHGADRARVAGVISLADGANISAADKITAIVDEVDGEIDDQELLLSRSVSAEGRSRATVGGARAPVGALTKLAEHLFVVHGQSEQLSLKSATQQRETLDRFDAKTIAPLLTEYRTAHSHNRNLQRERDEIVAARQERRREAARLRQEVDEITGVDPLPGEDEELETRLERLHHLEAIRDSVARATQALAAESDDPYQFDALTLVNQANAALQEISHLDPELGGHTATLSEAVTLLEEVSRDLGRYAQDLDSEGPAQLQAAQERKAQLDALKRNFGPELSDVHDYVATASQRLMELEADDSRLDELEVTIAELSETEQRLATELSAARSAAAQKLQTEVTRELRALALPHAELVVSVESGELASHGADIVTFQLKGHAGAEPKPLARSASGGELSRIMLALEVVLSQSNPVPTFVFDEVDAGVGGAAAIEIGRRLKKLSRSAQVIVVTHLAQVAAFADNHVQVAKDQAGGFTDSSCVVLDEQARETEIARLLSGLDASASAREHARELLDMGAQPQR